MSREEIRNLIGGYAAGNLTEAERAALFAAVLEDQELFDALAREQPLADLLEDPGARARVLAALGEPEAARPARRLWMRRPAVAALAASAAVAVVALVMLAPRGPRREEAQPAPVAEARKEAAPAPQVAPQPKPRAKARPAAKPKREEVQVMAQAPAATDSAAAVAFAQRAPVVARSSFRAGSGLLRAAAVRLTPEGSYEPVAEAGVAAGEIVRLRVQPAAEGQLRVVQRETPQGWRPVFNGKVEAGRTYFVPAEGSLRLEPGRQEFVVTLTAPQGLAERVVVEVK